MMTTMSDLPHDLIGENILTKVPITSLIEVRCTCKLWNAISKELFVGKETPSRHREFLGFMMASNKIYPFRFDIEGIRKHNSLVDPFMKQVNLLDQVEISKVFHYASPMTTPNSWCGTLMLGKQGGSDREYVLKNQT